MPPLPLRPLQQPQTMTEGECLTFDNHVLLPVPVHGRWPPHGGPPGVQDPECRLIREHDTGPPSPCLSSDCTCGRTSGAS
jgi:hypothetical protein